MPCRHGYVQTNLIAQFPFHHRTPRATAATRSPSRNTTSGPEGTYPFPVPSSLFRGITDPLHPLRRTHTFHIQTPHSSVTPPSLSVPSATRFGFQLTRAGGGCGSTAKMSWGSVGLQGVSEPSPSSSARPEWTSQRSSASALRRSMSAQCGSRWALGGRDSAVDSGLAYVRARARNRRRRAKLELGMFPTASGPEADGRSRTRILDLTRMDPAV
jgi:hypothetical protein